MRLPRTLVLLVLAFVIAGCTPSTFSGAAVFEEVVVTQVVDGDTIHVRFATGETEKVRLIGVDTPEDTTEHERFGAEATAYARDALDGQTVYLETDAELRDVHGRLLAYVWLEQPDDARTDLRELLFNAHLLLDGYAQLLTIPPNTRYVEDFRDLQAEARDAERGLWDLGDAMVFWSEAADHIGELVTLEGPVAGTYASPEGPTFINIGRDHPDPSRVTVFIPAGDREAWSEPPEDLYANETIRVTGELELYEGAAEIEVSDPSAIEVVE